LEGEAAVEFFDEVLVILNDAQKVTSNIQSILLKIEHVDDQSVVPDWDKGLLF